LPLTRFAAGFRCEFLDLLLGFIGEFGSALLQPSRATPGNHPEAAFQVLHAILQTTGKITGFVDDAAERGANGFCSVLQARVFAQ